jgi:S-DNA-T family DNA segregation ATPase FtsK/SpoIIIE
MMQTILSQLKIKADVVDSESNGIVSTYYLRLGPGAKVSKIENSSTEIALALKAYSKPLIKVIPEKGLVALEVLTNPLQNVSFSSISMDDVKVPLPMVLGKTHGGNNLILFWLSMSFLI